MVNVLLITLTALSALGVSASATPEGACVASAGNAACEDDAVAAIQLNRRHEAAAKLAEEVAAESDEPEWKDAIEHEKEVFARMAMLQYEKPEKYPRKHHPHHTKHPPSATNVQEPPQRAPPVGGYPYLPSLGVGGTAGVAYNWTATAYDVTPDYFEPNSPWNGPPSEPLRELPEIRSSNGMLKTTLTLEPAWLEVKNTGTRIRTRLFNGQYPGPTIRVKRGDLVEITYENKLECRPSGKGTWQRREGQAVDTATYPEAVPTDNAHYQYVGQTQQDPYAMRGVMNNFHDINTTNLHTHGWHVSSHLGQDDVVNTKIEPGKKWTYRYQLSPYHSSGASWYHGHWHGSVTSQVFGGAVGALIVDDDEGEAPEWIAKARDVTIVIHEADWSYFGAHYNKYFPDDPFEGCFPFNSRFSAMCAGGHRVGLMANLTGDRLWRMEYAKGYGYGQGQKMPVTSFLSVNGQYRPTLTMRPGEWVRLRMIFASGNVPVNPVLNASGCEMQLVSKDSAWLPEFPRNLTKGVWLGAGSRAQVMLRCLRPGVFRMFSNVSVALTIFASYDLMFLNVTGPQVAPFTPPKTVFKFPRYLQNLTNLSGSDIATPTAPDATNLYNGKTLIVDPAYTQNPSAVVQDGKTIVQAQEYDGPDKLPVPDPKAPTAYLVEPVRFTISNMTFNTSVPMASVPVGNVIEMNISGIATHSYHMHINPVQLKDFYLPPSLAALGTVEEIYGGYYRVGDWQDVVQMAPPGGYNVAAQGGPSVKVRFQTDCYNKVAIIHCHVLYHEDLGMMTWFNITGDDHVVDPRFQNQGIFVNPPTQCTKPGQQCAPPYCTDYKYGPPGH